MTTETRHSECTNPETSLTEERPDWPTYSLDRLQHMLDSVEADTYVVVSERMWRRAIFYAYLACRDAGTGEAATQMLQAAGADFATAASGPAR